VSGPPRLYDFFVQTPARRRPAADLDFHPVMADFGTTTQELHIGHGAVATPGVVRGLFEIHRYRGEVARAIAHDMRAGGQLTAEDLGGYRVERRAPLAVEHLGSRLLTNPPPSSGGLLIAFALWTSRTRRPELRRTKAHKGEIDDSFACLAALRERYSYRAIREFRREAIASPFR